MAVYIWISIFVLMIFVVIYHFAKGKQMLRGYKVEDKSKILFSTRSISPCSVRPSIKSNQDADNTYKLIITESEFILRPSSFDAYSERDSNLLHRVKLTDIIQLKIEDLSGGFSTLYIVFQDENNEEMEIAIASKQSEIIKGFLENPITKNRWN